MSHNQISLILIRQYGCTPALSQSQFLFRNRSQTAHQSIDAIFGFSLKQPKLDNLVKSLFSFKVTGRDIVSQTHNPKVVGSNPTPATNGFELSPA